MDNAINTSGNFASEGFEFIVGRNASGTEIYTFNFTFALMGNPSGVDSMYPFRMIFQTNRNQSSHNFSGSSAGSIAGSTPRCTARSSSFSPSQYNGSAFPLMYEPITFEISK